LAAPTFFGKGTLNGENAGTSITPIGFPASIAANDIAVIGVGCNGSSTFTTPSGQGAWAILGTSLESDAGQSTEWYWLRLTGSETAETVTASATFSNTVGGYGQLWVFRGCITTGNPFEGVGNAGTVSETTPDSSACTTTGPDRLVVCIAQLDNDTAFASGFPPSGWNDAGGGSYSFSTVGGDWATYCMHRTEASATTVASAVVGTLGASTRWRTITFALIPDTSITGTAAETQDNQTSTASGVIEITGTVTETQDAQTSTASGVLGYTGTSARTQADQTSTASGVLGYTGTSARTQANQTSTASGTVGGASEVTGSLAETQDNQTSTASGQSAITGTSARTQANQTSTASGTSTPPPITGTVARTQDNQTATAVGWIQITGLIAETQDNQTAVAAGTVSGVLSTKHLLTWTSDPHLLPWSPDAHLLPTTSDLHLQATTSDSYLVATTSDSHLLVVED